MGRRKGASRRTDIPPAVLKRINAGTEETITLVEFLAVDFGKLWKSVVPRPTKADSDFPADLGITRRMALAGERLFDRFGPEAYDRFRRHPSDMVRGWSAYVLTADESLSLVKRLKAIRPLADDPHSGVREWAWLAVRDAIAGDTISAVATLARWTTESSERLRRFASESTRPRGVWCAQLPLMIKEPDHGLPILEPLRQDPAAYVQNSVGNWLNDAAKSRPEWVREQCQRWQSESDHPATMRICRRGLRTLNKSK